MDVNIRWKLHLERAAMPLGMCLTLLLVEALWKPLGLPPVDVIVGYLKGAFETYGLWALAISAFIEGVFLVSFYLPGSMVIFSAILFSDRSFGALSEILAICWIAFMMAAIVNYYIGYFGLYRFFRYLGANRIIADTQSWMQRYGKLTYALSAFHPNYISMVEVCSGVGRQGLPQTLLMAGAAMAISGPVLVFGSALFIDSIVQEDNMGSMFAVFVGLFGLWAASILAKGIWDDMSSTPQPALERI